jgi:hypothetical protein
MGPFGSLLLADVQIRSMVMGHMRKPKVSIGCGFLLAGLGVAAISVAYWDWFGSRWTEVTAGLGLAAAAASAVGIMVAGREALVFILALVLACVLAYVSATPDLEIVVGFWVLYTAGPIVVLGVVAALIADSRSRT